MAAEKVLNLVDAHARGVQVQLADLGRTADALAYALVNSESPFRIAAPVFLNRTEFSEAFAAAERNGAEMICAVRDCFLLGPFGAVVLPTGQLVRQSVINLDGDALQYSLAQFTGQFPGRHIPWTAAEAPVFAVNSYATNNYFHFMIDSLAMLHWQDRLPALAQTKVILSGYPPEAEATLPFIPQALAAAGIGNLQPFDGTLLFCRSLIFPRRSTGADPARIAWLRRRFGITGPRGPERFYIARGAGVRRRLVNEPAVIKVLEGHGFTVIDPGVLSVRTQADLFARAAVVTGCHGAGLTNAAFMGHGGALIELTHAARAVRTYQEVAAAAGLSYAVVVGDTLDPTQPVLSDFTVDVDAVDAAVKAALQTL